jgi:hypothetical protein
MILSGISELVTIMKYIHTNLKELKDETANKILTSLYTKQKSINVEAKKSVFEFPVLISDSCDMDIALKIVTGLEYRNASLIKMIIQNMIFSGLDSKEAIIKKFKSLDFMDEQVNKFLDLPEIKDYIKSCKFTPSCITEENKSLNVNLVNEADERTKDHNVDKVESRFNKIQPFIFDILFDFAPSKNDKVQNSKITLGVKSVSHIVPFEEFVKYLPVAKYDTSLIIKLTKLYTGEIKFFRDLILNLKDTKDTFTTQEGKFNWYGKLRRLKSKKIEKSIMGKGVNLSPITTIVISSSDAEEMAYRTKGKFNILNDGTCKKLIESLFLLNFIIVNEHTGQIMMFDDSSNTYSIHTVDEFEKEGKDISQKDLLKTILMVGNR